MKNRIILYSCIALMAASCNKSPAQNYQVKLKNCINKDLLKTFNSIHFVGNPDNPPSEKELKEFDIFDTIQKFENNLIQSNALEDRTRKGYQKLLEKLKQRKVFKPKQWFLLKQNNAYLIFANNFILPDRLYRVCPLKTFNKTSSKELKKIQLIYDKIIRAEGIQSLILIEKLTQISNFEDNKVLRLSTCNLILLFLLNTNTTK